MYRTYMRMHMHHPLAINFTLIKTPCRTACNIMRDIIANILVKVVRFYWLCCGGTVDVDGTDVGAEARGIGVDVMRENFSNKFMLKF